MNFLKKSACLFLSLLLALSCTFLAAPAALAAGEAPQIGARNVYLVEANTGRVLLRKNERERINPASTTKIMTALLAVEAIEDGYAGLSDVVTVKNGCYFDVSSDASIQDLRYGEQITLQDLLYCVMVASACEACNVVAEWISGSAEAFIGDMNDRARELGCIDTQFANTHGLSNEQHWTTAYDLYLIYREAMKHDLFRTLNSASAWRVDPTNKQPARTFYSTNKLLLSNSSYYYEYCTGGKTGSTSQAGYCLVSSAENGELSLISILMGDQGVDKNGNKDKNIAMSDTVKLFNWAFATYSYRAVLPTTHLIAEVPVEMGDGASSVLVRPAREIIALAREDMSESDLHFRITIYSQEEGEALLAPVTAGDVLGEAYVTFYDDVTGQELPLGSVSLVANTSIALSKAVYLESRVQEFLHQKWLKWLLYGAVGLVGLYLLLLLRYTVIRRKRKAAAKANAERRMAARESARQAMREAHNQQLREEAKKQSFSDEFDVKTE